MASLPLTLAPGTAGEQAFVFEAPGLWSLVVAPPLVPEEAPALTEPPVLHGWYSLLSSPGN